MPGWSRGAECVFGLAGENLVHGKTGGAAAAQSRIDRARRQERIRIECDSRMGIFSLWFEFEQPLPVIRGMREFELILGGARSGQHLGAGDVPDAVDDRGNPCRGFSVTRARIVFPAIVVMQDQCFHQAL